MFIFWTGEGRVDGTKLWSKLKSSFEYKYVVKSLIKCEKTLAKTTKNMLLFPTVGGKIDGTKLSSKLKVTVISPSLKSLH